MTIFITGDIHGNVDLQKLNDFTDRRLTRDDILLVAGDFGAPWQHPESKLDRSTLRFHEKQPYTTVFIDGNHENFHALETYPIVNFHGARCHRIRPHVFHMMRGEVLNAEGHRIWGMGGAVSVDRKWRTENVSWWPQEVPSLSEWRHAEEMLIAARPNMIVTHDAPASVIQAIYRGIEDRIVQSQVTEHLEQILQIIKAQAIPATDWYFGHHHTDHIYRTNRITFHALCDAVTEIAPKT